MGWTVFTFVPDPSGDQDQAPFQMLGFPRAAFKTAKESWISSCASPFENSIDV